MTNFNISKYYFSHARTALKFGLQAFNFTENDVVLLPEFICSVLIDPIVQIGVKIKFYPINEFFEPQWCELEAIVKRTDNVKGLLMVHYFGSVQNIIKFNNFCSSYNLILIEDNAHGYGNKYEDKLLGTFGDIGICSPRKILNLNFGGILYLKNNKIKDLNSYNSLEVIQFSFINYLLKNHLYSLAPKLKNLFKKHLFVKPEYNNPYAFQENSMDDYRIDYKTIRLINRFDHNKNFYDKINKYESWKRLLLKYNYNEILEFNSLQLTPFCFSFYANDKVDAQRFFNWGWNNGYYIYSWPSLPGKVINENATVLKIWERLVCISLDSLAPQELLNL